MTTVHNAERLPPGPDGEIDISVPDNTLDTLLALFREYGGIFKVFSPAKQVYTYVVNDPDCIKHVLVTNHRNYMKGAGIERVRILLGNGIMASEGEIWKRQRRMIQPFFQRQMIAQFFDLMKRCDLALLGTWEQKARAQERINLTADMSEVTLEIILRAVFSEDLDAIIATAGGNPFSIVTEETARDLQFARKFRALTKLVLEIINRRRREERWPGDFLSMLTNARDKQTDRPMSDKELIDEVMTLLVAGHETTASALNWTWYLISQHPDAEAKLHREVDDVLGGRAPGFEDLPKLPYTRQVVEEALRLYPPGWLLTRRALGEDRIGGYHVAPGTDVYICPYILHRHPHFWDDPEQFMPERFAQEESAGRHRYAYIPFAAGPRHCVGEFFAMVEMQVHIALVAQRIRLAYIPERPVELAPLVNLRTRHDLFMLPQVR